MRALNNNLNGMNTLIHDQQPIQMISFEIDGSSGTFLRLPNTLSLIEELYNAGTKEYLRIS